jgi:hypothetical protein
MLLQSTGKQYNLNYFESPRWADIIAQLWLITLCALGWLRTNYPKAQLYTVIKMDLARRQLAPCPVAITFARFVFVFLWIDLINNIATFFLLGRGGGLCLA